MKMRMSKSVDRQRMSGWRPVRVAMDNRRVYLGLNVATYGLVLAGFGAGLVFPGLQHGQQVRLEQDGTAELVLSIFHNPWLFAFVILAVNTLKLSLMTIVVPSLIVPFAGMALFAYWAAQTGAALAPASDIGWVALIPHSVTLLIELQAYILLVLGAFLLGRAWIRPENVGAQTHRGGYLGGLRQLGWLAMPAAGLLVVGALYEAFSLRYLLNPLAQWLL
ncbi:stage II sporulation protein M [Mycobacterium sp. PSTR-4-N]|uniref:stage II sporulation protein M n=1 Tax=Mycobacterium sp. PSTR-4-N TaxID=2917745 RepID=UPI001F1525BC|nr:stage II sporulation protein M [Mycobacterium sp. PSTR-4-N]